MNATTTSTTSTASMRGSARWMAIELLASSLDDDPSKPVHHTKATDVWAYGMVVYELLTGAAPYAHLKNDLRVAMAIANGQIPSVPTLLWCQWDQDGHLLWNICQTCWRTAPTNRHTMEHICTWLFQNAQTHSPNTVSSFATTTYSSGSPPPTGTSLPLPWSSPFTAEHTCSIGHIPPMSSCISPITDLYARSVNRRRPWDAATTGLEQITGPANGFTSNTTYFDRLHLEARDPLAGNAKATGQDTAGARREGKVPMSRSYAAGACVRCKACKVKCEYTPDDPSTCRRCLKDGRECTRRVPSTIPSNLIERRTVPLESRFQCQWPNGIPFGSANGVVSGSSMGSDSSDDLHRQGVASSTTLEDLSD